MWSRLSRKDLSVFIICFILLKKQSTPAAADSTDWRMEGERGGERLSPKRRARISSFSDLQKLKIFVRFLHFQSLTNERR